MSMRIRVYHFCLNTTIHQWPPSHSIQSCNHDGMGVVTCSSIFKGTLENIPKLTVFKVINTGKTYFANPDLGVAPKKVVWYYKIRQVGRTGDVCRKTKQSAWERCPMNQHEGLLSKQAGFQISDAIMFFTPSPPTLPAYLAVPDHFLWGYITCNIPPANINELKECIWERIQGFPKDAPKHVMTMFPLQLQ